MVFLYSGLVKFSAFVIFCISFRLSKRVDFIFLGGLFFWSGHGRDDQLSSSLPDIACIAAQHALLR